MDNYFVCILLCIVQRLLVNGQMLVSHKDGVIVTSSSQHVPYDIWDISHVVDSTVEYDPDICQCCGATKNDASPWFKLDLGEEYNIQRIHVIGRQNSYQYLYNMEIQLGTTEADGTVLQGVDTSDTDLRELNYKLPSPEFARFITLTLRDITQYFLICELYVYAVCIEGTYGPDCVNTCGQCKNNEPCDGVTGACSECLNGYQSPLCQDCSDRRYGPTCEECGHCYNNDVCDKSHGTCPSGCLAGYQGTTCENVCSLRTYGVNCEYPCGNCENNAACNSVDGACTACVPGYLVPMCKECIDGRYGSTCNEECGNCNNNDVCDKSSGDCPSACSVGYQGTNCKGVCSWGAYGLGCAYTCGRCENNATCNNVDGTCTACATGYLSPMCKDCIAGRYGPTCNEECGYCINNDTCDTSNGNCPSVCSAGYKGNICKQACSLGKYGMACAQTCGNCENNETCENVNGACRRCVMDYLSPMCKDCIDGRYSTTCNEDCGHCINTDVCDKTNGNCKRGCSAGYKGTTCKKECEDGTFGLGCEEKCGNCFNNGPCNKQDGKCATCAAGYKGHTCVDECQYGTFGFNCKQRCGMCQEGDVCDIYTGECPNGCIVEYKGSQCSQEINQDALSSSDTCISIPVFIGSLFAVIVVNTTSVIGLVWLFYRKRLNKKAHKAADNKDTSIPLPNTASNYDTLQFDNPDRESTYTELNRRS